MSFDIKYQDHFKLYVLVQDRFTFESELRKNGIDFYSDTDEQVFTSESIRYFLKSENRLAIDDIVIEKQINTGIESIGVTNTDFNITPMTIVSLILIFIVLIIVLTYIV